MRTAFVLILSIVAIACGSDRAGPAIAGGAGSSGGAGAGAGGTGAGGTDAGTMGAAGGGGAGRTGGAGRGGASGGAGGASGAGGAAMCVPLPMSLSTACRECVVATCGTQAAACFGPGWLTGDVRGSLCEQYVGCFCGCPDGDSTCAGECNRMTTPPCAACIQQASDCVRGCDMVCSDGRSGATSCGSGTGGGAGTRDGGMTPGRSIECMQTSAGPWHCTCSEEGRVVATCNTTAADACAYPSCCPFAP